MAEIMELHEALDLEHDPRMDWDGNSESSPPDIDDIVATTAGTPASGISFNVEMRTHTMQDMESLIIHAAASQILGKHQDRKIAKDIQDVCLTQINEKINEKMSTITADIMNQPLIPGMVSGANTTPVSMSEYVGIVTRDFLSQYVDPSTGNKFEPSRYNSQNKVTRLEYIVNTVITKKLRIEIETETNKMIAEVAKSIKEEQARILAEEKAKILEALKALH